MKRTCINCMDFNSEDSTCTIRYVIKKNGDKMPMPRKPNQKGCEVFLLKPPKTKDNE